MKKLIAYILALLPLLTFAQGGSADFFKVKPTTNISELEESSDSQTESLYSEIEKLIQSGNIKEALIKAEYLIYQLPDSHIGYFMKGLAHMNGRNFDSAIFSFDRAIKKQPLETSSLLNKALVYLEMGDPIEADVQVQKIARISKNDINYLIGNGVLTASRGDYEKAIKSLKEAELVSELPYINWLLSICYLRLGKEDLAAAEAQKLLDRDPSSFLGKLLMAQFNATFLRNYPEAIDQANELMANGFSTVNILSIAMTSYYNSEDYKEAFDIILKYFNEIDVGWDRSELSFLNILSGLLTTDLDPYQERQKTNRYYKVLLNLALGDKRKVLEEIELYPDHPLKYLILSYYALNQGRMADFRKYYESLKLKYWEFCPSDMLLKPIRPTEMLDNDRICVKYSALAKLRLSILFEFREYAEFLKEY